MVLNKLLNRMARLKTVQTCGNSPAGQLPGGGFLA